MMRTFSNSVVSVVLSLLVASAVAPCATRAGMIDASGTFSIHGKAPQAFANIEVLEIGGNDEYGWKANPPFYGFIRLNNKARTDYKLLKPTIDGNNISFKTRTVGGVSYEFEGSFSRLDFAEKDLRNQAVLSGTLKKIVGGKTAAEAKLDFDYTPGG